MELLHVLCIGVHYLHVRCQSGERLSPTSPNTQEKSIAWRLPQDPADSADVLYCIHEKHKLQLWGVDLIVLLQVIFNHNLQLRAERVNCGYQIKAIVRGRMVVCKHSQASGRAEPGAQQGLGAAAPQLLPRSCLWGSNGSLLRAPTGTATALG